MRFRSEMVVLGPSESAALRGAEAEHTAVLFGDVPLTSADAGAFDLSALPLALAERVVVYRGGAPLWLSQGSIGGIVQLIPRTAADAHASVTATAGSFGSYGLTTDSSVKRGTLELQALGLSGKPLSIFDFDFDTALRRRIVFGEHCFGCTAGAGSSCGGATA